MILELDYSQSRQGSITRDSPHFHGLLLLPLQVTERDRLEITYLIDDCLTVLFEVEKSKTQVFDIRKSLGRTQDYSAKYGKLLGQANDVQSHQTTIFPIDNIRDSMTRGDKKKEEWQVRADTVLAKFYWDPTIFFSQEYCEYFDEELKKIGRSDFQKRDTCNTFRSLKDVELYHINSQKTHCTSMNSITRKHSPKKPKQTITPTIVGSPRHGRRNNFSDQFSVSTFQDCESWADKIRERFVDIRKTEKSRGDATNWLSLQVASFAERMLREGRIERIHHSSVHRLRNVRSQDRSCYAVIMLLLSTRGHKLFTRSVRFRVAKKAEQVGLLY